MTVSFSCVERVSGSQNGRFSPCDALVSDNGAFLPYESADVFMLATHPHMKGAAAGHVHLSSTSLTSQILLIGKLFGRSSRIISLGFVMLSRDGGPICANQSHAVLTRQMEPQCVLRNCD